MKLTAQATETLVRRLASAGRDELEACTRDLKAMGTTSGQPERIKTTCSSLATVTRRLARELT